MKKVFLITSLIFLTCEILNCQWYQKYYGVDDPNVLTREQINLALNKSLDGVKTGRTLLVIGSIGILTGAYLFLKDYPDEKYPDQAEIGKKFEGVLMALIFLPPEIIGFAVLKKNMFRRTEIEEYIKNNTELKVVLINYPSERYVVPGFSVRFRF